MAAIGLGETDPMLWEVLSLRYARHDRKKQESFLMPVEDPHSSMPLDYFVWLLRGEDGSEAAAAQGANACDQGRDAAVVRKRVISDVERCAEVSCNKEARRMWFLLVLRERTRS